LIAAVLADKRLGELREWALNPSNFDAGTGFPNSAKDPDFPGYTIATTVVPMDRYSPCSQMEAPSGNPRKMSQSFKRVEVFVSWGATSSERIGLVSLQGAPSRDLASLTIQGGIPNPVPPGSPYPIAAPVNPVVLRGEARDAGGNIIPDVFFQWVVRNNVGVATIFPDHDDVGAKFYNWFATPQRPLGGPTAPGDCQIAVRARSRVLSPDVTQTVTLAP
jgi:hypothetical protein